MIKMGYFLTPLILVSVLAAPLAPADTLVEYGVINRVDYDQENALVIDDQYYPMALNMKVKGKKGVTATRYALKKGQKVRFNITGSKQIDQIWILPDSTTRPRDKRRPQNRRTQTPPIFEKYPPRHV